MQTQTRSRNQPLWSKALAQPAIEFGPTQLAPLAGQIPPGLRGSLYRNGPGRLERGGQRVAHWFDGDGGILAVHFGDTAATGLYRYVQTQGYREEDQAGHYLYGGYGQLASGPLWNRWLRPLKNAANTSVLALPDRLLALWEGGNPHRLDLEDLSTKGLDDLEASLEGNQAYSAHPKRDPQTGEFWNFGVAYQGATSTLNLYHSDATGRVIHKGKVSIEGAPLIHDFALCGRFLVFCVPPVMMQWAGLPLLLGLQSYSQTLQWQADQPTRILIIDRDTLQLVAQAESEPWYQWHFSNGYEAENGTLVVDLLRYPDFKTNEHLREVAEGETHTEATAQLWRLHLDLQTGKVLDRYALLDRPCEFAVVPPAQVGQQAEYTYLNLHPAGANPAQELFGAVGRVDLKTGDLQTAVCGAGLYPMEPIYAPDALNPNQGWIITVVFDGNQSQSEVWIYAADALAQGPACRLALPQIIPLGFHGTWRPR
ncbi:carotenoid oxygenase family protein [Leptolyngbya sp. FACHB-261]|uniref:carotenoid oxygenase family protein n=1 Tax=Leptolyngbya sp. FACHB-261 TaxID=2692806 RepID=UPI0016855BA8|nr:carotenoid oxygenase family protein [Leptolyngbya sp. FACHB-261]MBD2100559.1 carotenoid oxygenase family protein [Leptolyngbya sp. FACHB-261]